LRVASLNCQNGVTNIELQMLALARENDVDVLYLQETEIPDSSADLFSLPAFEVFAEKGKDNVRVLTLVKKNIFDSVTQLEPSSRDRWEICLKVERNCCQPTVLVNFYCEWLNGNLVAKQGRIEQMVEAATSFEIQNVFAMGDLNLDLSWTMDTDYRYRQHADETINLTAEGGLDYHGFGITWSRTKNGKLMESSIDWLFARGQVARTWKKTAGFTDHLMIGFNLHLNGKKPKSKAATVWRRNINRVDVAEL
jgi:endonuclease/exonuclease/phosphatase family metal-dependent hydrolase